MVKVSVLNATPTENPSFYSVIKEQDRFLYSRVTHRNPFLSRAKIKKLYAYSLLPEIVLLWNALSDEVKNDWAAAAKQCNTTGYRLFVKDTTHRKQLGYEGLATPNLFHQDKVGKIVIESPAQQIKIIQIHPSSYYIYRKVTGKKAMFNPVQITEGFSLPFDLSLNYKADLVEYGGTAQAKIYGLFKSSYQGVDRFDYAEIDLDLQTDWKSDSVRLDHLQGYFIAYNLFIEINNARGTILFDNIKAEHSGTNWIRDPWCNDINQTFTKAYSNIPKHWAPITLPNGAGYDSIYPED